LLLLLLLLLLLSLLPLLHTRDLEHRLLPRCWQHAQFLLHHPHEGLLGHGKALPAVAAVEIVVVNIVVVVVVCVVVFLL